VTIGTTTGGIDSLHHQWQHSERDDGTLYSAPITVSSTTTINAIAYEAGLTDSAISTATYTIGSGRPWYNAGGTWTNRKSITVAHGQVSGSSNLTNYPMLFQ